MKNGISVNSEKGVKPLGHSLACHFLTYMHNKEYSVLLTCFRDVGKTKHLYKTHCKTNLDMTNMMNF